jgi:hypothetical protein
MQSKSARRNSVLLIPLLAAAALHASVIQIDSTVNGCSGTCLLDVPGSTLNNAETKLQLTLGPGTYTVTNAATTGTYSAWNTHDPNAADWVWAFGVANDATGVVLLDDYVGTSALNMESFATQAAAAGATGIHIYDGNNLLSATSTAAFSDTFTLSATSKLDFYVPDQYTPDNTGGIALNVTLNPSGVPEPATFWLVVPVLAAACLRLRRRAS